MLFLRLTLLCAALSLQAAQRPDFVIFLADDLSRNDCSIYNPKAGISTPNMERIAREGLTFNQAFVSSPSCAPSRGALLTGLHPTRNGAMWNHTVPDPRFKRWPAYFQELGYEVVAIGKVAHYATVQQYGFDHCSHFNYHQDDCVEVAVQWLRNRTTATRSATNSAPVKPLCLFVGSNWPHVPWPTNAAPEPYLLPTQVNTPETRHFRARYARAVEFADRDLGLVYDAARECLGTNAFFLFTSDNGSQFPFGKWNLYDAGIHMPMMVAWPGRVAAGSRTDAMVMWEDILPTCLEIAGTTPPPAGTGPGEISGRSFLPVLRGRATEHRRRVFNTHSGDGKMNDYPMRSVRSRDWKYVRNLNSQGEHHTHVDRGGRETSEGYWPSWERQAAVDPAAAAIVQRYHKRPAEELFDLRNDPLELRNLAGDPKFAEQLAGFRAELADWMKQNGDQGLPTDQERRPKPAQPKPNANSKQPR